MASVSQLLATLGAVTAKWFDFGDGTRAPGQVLYDSTTGLPVDFSAATLVAFPTTKQFSGSLTANGDIGPFTMDEFSSFNFRINDMGGGGSIAVSGSNDQTQWSTIATLSTSATGSSDAATQQTAVGMYSGVRAGKYLKFTLSGYVSGTVSVAGEMSHAPARTFSGNVQAQGATAHGGNVSTKPVRLAARGRDFGSSYTALTVDQTADLVANLVGHLKVSREHGFRNITTQTTTTVKSGKGLLSKLNINTAVALAVATVYDNTAGSGTLIGTFDCSAKGSYDLDLVFGTGLTIVTSGGSADITVSYL